MAAPDEVAQNIAIIYFSIYAFVFLVASIYSAYEVELIHHLLIKNDNSNNNKLSEVHSQIELNVITTSENEHDVDDAKYNEPIDNKSHENKHICKRLLKFFRYWTKSLWTKKSIYISIIPHLFDQATDVGVLYTYYEIWQNPQIYPIPNERLNMKAIFFSSVFIIIESKIISCGAIFAITRKYIDILLQFVDLMMLKAVYLNYKYKTNEPGNAQRYLQILEATFESAPQIVISMIFILKTQTTDVLVLISTVSSLWTLTSRVKNDDKHLLEEDWRNSDFSLKKFPCVNFLYLFRVIFWRFFEITTRVFLLCLIWIAMGGFALIIIMGFELSCALIICFYGEGVIVLGNMMYFTASAVGAVPYTILVIAKAYKLFSIFFYLIIITCFIMIPFEAWKVGDYSERHQIIEDPLSLTIFIYTWIASCCWVCSFYLIAENGLREEVSSTRQLKQIFKDGQYGEALNLIGFGADPKILYGEMFAVSTSDYYGNVNVLEALLLNCSNDPMKNIQIIFLFKLLYEGVDVLTVNDIVLSTAFGSSATCLHYAASKSAYLLKYMIEKIKKSKDDFDINSIKDKLGGQCIRNAFTGENFESIIYLVSKCNATVEGVDKDKIEKAFHSSFSLRSKAALETVTFLHQECGAVIDQGALEAAVRQTKDLQLLKYVVETPSIGYIDANELFRGTLQIRNFVFARYFMSKFDVLNGPMDSYVTAAIGNDEYTWSTSALDFLENECKIDINAKIAFNAALETRSLRRIKYVKQKYGFNFQNEFRFSEFWSRYNSKQIVDYLLTVDLMTLERFRSEYEKLKETNCTFIWILSLIKPFCGDMKFVRYTWLLFFIGIEWYQKDEYKSLLY
eukprot:510807_1